MPLASAASYNLLSLQPVVGAPIGGPLANGLVFCAPMNEGSGVGRDAVGGISPAVAGTAPVWSTVGKYRGPNWTAGTSYFSYGGTASGTIPKWASSYVSSLNVKSLNFSVMCVAIPNVITRIEYCGLWAGTYGWALSQINVSSYLEFAVQYGGFNFVSANSGVAPVAGTLYNMIGTVDYHNTLCTFYLNGAKGAATAAHVPDPTSVNNFTIGGDADGAHANSTIFIVAVWNRVLSLPEIQVLNANPYAMFLPTAPQQRWWFLYKAGGTFLAPRPLVVGQAVKRASIY